MFKYIHPGTIKQGYLTKSPPLEKTRLKQWKKRWCIFSRANGEDPCIMYYRTEETAFSSLPIKRIELKHCFKVEMDLVHSNHKNIFAIHLPDRVYYFSAPSRIEMSEWSDALSTHLKLSLDDSPSHNAKARANSLPAAVYGNTKTPLAPEAFYASNAGHTLPAESVYNSTQHPTVATPPLERVYASRPLPKTPNSPLPPIPMDASGRLQNPTSPTRSSRTPPPPPLHSHSPAPPPPPHSPSPYGTPPHIRVPSPQRQRSAPPVPSHNSPLMAPQRAQIAPPPPHPYRPDTNNRQPNSADDIAFRPPAPPPKAPSPLQTSPTGSIESLEEAPPTPPPRLNDTPTTLSPALPRNPATSSPSAPRDPAPSQLRYLPDFSSSTRSSSSDSEDDIDILDSLVPPVCPPRPSPTPAPRKNLPVSDKQDEVSSPPPLPPRPANS